MTLSQERKKNLIQVISKPENLTKINPWPVLEAHTYISAVWLLNSWKHKDHRFKTRLRNLSGPYLNNVLIGLER